MFNLDKVIDILEDNKYNYYNINSELHIDLENIIGLNYNSKLVKDLLEVFRKIHKYVDENINKKGKPINIYSEVCKGLNRLYSEKIINIINKNLGIKLNQFSFFPNIGAYFSLNKSWFLFYNTNEFLSFGRFIKPIAMANDYKKYDFDLKKFTSTTNMEKIQPVISFGLMNISSIGTFSLTGERQGFTPEESVAVLCHEIGHMITITINMIYNGYTGITSAIRVDELRENIKNIKDQKDFFSSIYKTLDHFDKYKDPLIDNSRKFLRKLENRSLSDDTLKFIGLIIIGFLFGAILEVIISNILQYTVLKVINYSILNKSINKSNIHSRSIYTNQNAYMNERWADEFVSKLGMSQYLVTALAKLYKYPVNDEYFNAKNIIDANLCSIGVAEMSRSVFNRYGIYEDMIDRMKRLKENNISFLKDNNIDDSIKKIILEQNYKIKKLIIELEKLDNKNILKRIFKFLKIPFNSKTFKNIFEFEYNLLSDHYEKFNNEIDEFMNNELFELSYKLKSLINNTK